jgi:NAD(P)-dependent dehydrogenase (short-subunit alcohol dehydrogenase family)
VSAGPATSGRQRVALVTGAGRGIGRAAAVALAAQGLHVMGVARSQDQLERLGGEIGASWLVADLAEPVECARAVNETLQRLGRIDVLVNNAGAGSAGEREVWQQDPAHWRRTMALNVDSPFELTRRVLPGMLQRGSGRIVMVASLASLGAGVAPGMSAYATSKHALLGLARAVAIEVAGSGVTCNSVLPGSVRTATAERKVAIEAELAGSTIEEAWAARADSTAGRRLLEASEVADVIAFLASDAASGVNGQAIPIALQAYG